MRGNKMSNSWRLKTVIGPNGRLLTLADLPPTNLRRWYPYHKACIASTVRGGLISVEEVCKRYSLTVDEIHMWQQALDRCGVKGLRVSGKCIYRSARSFVPTDQSDNSNQQHLRDNGRAAVDVPAM